MTVVELIAEVAEQAVVTGTVERCLPAIHPAHSRARLIADLAGRPIRAAPGLPGPATAPSWTVAACTSETCARVPAEVRNHIPTPGRWRRPIG